MKFSIFCVALLALIGCVYVAGDSPNCGPQGGGGGCDPNSAAPCCSKWGYCGSTAEHCNCDGCTDPRTRESPNCGPQGGGGGCDPNSAGPCCSKWGYCGSTAEHCNCDGCTDYRRCEHRETGLPGLCKRFWECPFAVEERKKHNRKPQLCNFDGNVLLICCPDPRPVTPAGASTTTTPAPDQEDTLLSLGRRGGVARYMCAQYSKYVYKIEDAIDTCVPATDTLNTLIVGGKEAKPREFPHMALVGFGESPNIEYRCGGSLISPRFVLTAAHCIVTPRGRPAKWVKLGEGDLNSERNDDPQVVEVQERIPHPEYKPPAFYHDIALLRLSRDADLNEFVRPACLHTEFEVRTTPELPNLLATGWGHTEWGGHPSDKLMKVGLPLSKYAVCKEHYESASKLSLPQGLKDDSMICAGGVMGKDPCQGDSGGPLQVPTSNNSVVTEPYCMFNVVGVTSFGKGCGTTAPAVYTRVFHYVPWIEGVVWPSVRPSQRPPLQKPPPQRPPPQRPSNQAPV